jgi:hypothetical protein
MTLPRTLLLFDPGARPQSWNERMGLGEYAVLYSEAPQGVVGLGGPVCTVFGTLAEAEAHAAEQVVRQPGMRCRIYDADGLAKPPVREVRGSGYKAEGEISARFRRWGGSLLFFGGLGLIVLDWSKGFRMSWPALVGARMLPVGLVLVVTEGVIQLEARRKRRRGNSPRG